MVIMVCLGFFLVVKVLGVLFGIIVILGVGRLVFWVRFFIIVYSFGVLYLLIIFVLY